jgi:zinc transporter ZupT
MRTSKFFLSLWFSTVRTVTFTISCIFDEEYLETFEGLAIGSRLAYLELPKRLFWVRLAGAILYGVTTPIGIAVGLGVRTTYNPESTTASIVSGVMDSLSAGILIYTGLVEVSKHLSVNLPLHLF